MTGLDLCTYGHDICGNEYEKSYIRMTLIISGASINLHWILGVNLGLGFGVPITCKSFSLERNGKETWLVQVVDIRFLN